MNYNRQNPKIQTKKKSAKNLEKGKGNPSFFKNFSQKILILIFGFLRLKFIEGY